MLERLRVWNIWRKCNANGWLHHVLVLFGLRVSPTFYMERVARRDARVTREAFFSAVEDAACKMQGAVADFGTDFADLKSEKED